MRSPIPILVSLIALILAMSSLYISISSRNEARAAILTEQEIDKRLDYALAKKEEEYVASLYPKVESIYKTMLSTYKTPKEKPKTFKELLAPMLEIITHAGS